MACSSCGTSKNGQPKGCKNNGTCGTDSCNKLTVFNWLANMQLPNGQEEYNILEVRFKNDRKEYLKNTNNLTLQIGDAVAVETTGSGHDIGVVSLKGELVKVKIRNDKKRKKLDEFLGIYRKANPRDIEVWHQSREKEQEVMIEARKIAKRLNLEMKISDVEFQADGTRCTFYYTSETRVDFRQLIREFAATFNVRIEMKQIGYRQEAAKVGGIGSCGRELCCSTWLTDFRSVSTTAARYQQLSINPQKLAGQCGKLKCCLNYELDSYIDALKGFPRTDTYFLTEKGKAICIKTDIFKKEMWFCYEKDGIIWYKFSVNNVKDYVALNKKGEKTPSLEDLEKETNITDTKVEFKDVIEENSLDRFERKNKRKSRNNNKTRPKKQTTRSPQSKSKPKPNQQHNSNKPNNNSRRNAGKKDNN